MTIRWDDIDELPPSVDTILLAQLIAALALFPCRTPQDVLVADKLLNYAAYLTSGNERPDLMMTHAWSGVHTDEARAISPALAALALRLGAYLGRDAT